MLIFVQNLNVGVNLLIFMENMGINNLDFGDFIDIVMVMFVFVDIFDGQFNMFFLLYIDFEGVYFFRYGIIFIF